MTPLGLREASHRVEVDHIQIPTRDGTRLGAALFRPAGASRVPVVVEYTPYRKDDLRGASRDFGSFYFAERGIVAVQLDVRGTGASEGVVTDEYQHPQEQQDACDALAWLAAQSWCNGRTGMWGTSYAGFTALQVAQLQPPSLGAIAPIYATDDRYTDDMHFRGGALNGWSVIGPYALGMVTRNALPPYPERSENWEALWEARMAGNAPWLIRWLEEQRDGPYWRSTLGRRYAQVQVPTLMVGGWGDFYVNAAWRWFVHLRGPKKLIMGPWPHTPPDAAVPGPRIDFLREITRWFAHWLADEPTRILDEPPVALFIQASRRPGIRDDAAPGFWRCEETLPPERTTRVSFYLHSDGRLAPTPQREAHTAEQEYVPFVGFADLGVGGGPVGGGAQTLNDAFSLTFTSEPLEEDLEILGMPATELTVAWNMETGFVSVRLSDVAPDGAATLVSKGLLNATRRSGMERVDPLPRGDPCPLTVELNAVSWIFPRGHRLRLSLAGADFPEVWPSPLAGTMRVHCGGVHPAVLTLPVLAPPATPLPTPRFDPPPPRRSQFEHRAAQVGTSVAYDVGSRTMSAARTLSDEVRHPDGVTEITNAHRTEMEVSSLDPAAAVASGWDRKTIRRPGWEVESEARATLKGSTADFDLTIELHVTLNGETRCDRRWTRRIPRDAL